LGVKKQKKEQAMNPQHTHQKIIIIHEKQIPGKRSGLVGQTRPNEPHHNFR
jgi:hypothetical protein